MIPDKDELAYWRKYYGQLVGYTVTEAKVDEDGTPYLTFVKDGKGMVCNVLMDPEGNGPGFLDNLPRPKVKS